MDHLLRFYSIKRQIWPMLLRWAGRSVEDRLLCKQEVVGSKAGQQNIPPGPYSPIVFFGNQLARIKGLKLQ